MSLEAGAQLADIVIAVIAVGLSVFAVLLQRRTARATELRGMSEREVQHLFEALVRAKYLADQYKELLSLSGEAKRVQRTMWAVGKEALKADLFDYSGIFPEHAAIIHAWRVLDDTEDVWAVKDASTTPDEETRREIVLKYNKALETFRSAVLARLDERRREPLSPSPGRRPRH